MSETIKTILTAETGQFKSEFAKATSTINNFQKNVVTMGAALGGSAILAAAVGKFNALRESINLLEDQAARLQMPIDEFQRLGFFAEKSGTTVEALSKALTRSKLGALEARAGSESLSKAFADLGIDAANFAYSSQTDQILALSRGFNNATDSGAAFAAIYRVMGKGASELIPLLKMGESELAAISSRLKVLGSADAAAVGALSDEIELLAANMKTELGGAVVALSPQIQGLVKLLADAAEGMAVALDPAGGIGKGGGVLGGAQMLEEIDRLTPKIANLKQELSGKSWWEGTADLKISLRESQAAVETLKARFGGLTEETKAYAEQLAEVERLRKSGLSGEGLDRAVQAVQERTAETLKSIESEKALATASAETAEQMEHQATAAAATAQAVANLKERVSRRILDAQSPEKRKEAAESDLSGILTREKAGGIGEIRDRVNTAANPEDQQRALRALDDWMDRQADLKKATEELKAAAKGQADANEAGFESSRAAAESFRNTLDGLYAKQDREREQARDQATARANYAASVRAIQLELAGREDLADKLRQEVDLLGQVRDFAKGHGVSEEEALKRLRARLGWEERLKKLKETQQNAPASRNTGGVRRGRIYIKDSALHHDDGARFQGVGGRRIGLRNHEVSRRNTDRAVLHGGFKGEGSAGVLLKILHSHEETQKIWQKLGVI